MLLDELVGELAVFVDSVEPGCFSGSDAARLTELFDRGEKLCAAGKALMARRAADCNEWSKTGARSPAEWLASVSGTTHNEAQGALQTAEAATAQPALDAAMRSGELSVDQANVICDAAKDHPDAVEELLEVAKSRNLSGLRQQCRQVEARSISRQEDEAKAKRLHDMRYLKMWADQDGTGRIDGRVDPLAFNDLRCRLAPFEKHVLDQARAQGRRESFDAYRADALTLMAQAATTSSDPGDTGNQHSDADPLADPTLWAGSDPFADPNLSGSPDAAALSSDAAYPAGSSSSGPAAASLSAGPSPPPNKRVPTEMIVVVDRAALIRGYTTGSEVCYIDGFGPIPVAAAREMLDDAFLAGLLKDGIDIRRVVHPGRHPTRMQKTALLVRDPQCVVPGCEATQGLEHDHIPEWEITHHTTIDELARLCSFHHDQRTYHGATLTGGPDHWHWTPPPPGPFDTAPQGGGPFDTPPQNPAPFDTAPQNPGPFDDPRPTAGCDNEAETSRPQPELFDTG